MGLVNIITPDAVNSRRVSSIGGYTQTHGTIIFFIGSISGMVFGGIHCTAWNFLFQGQTIWRVASIVILCTPLSFLLACMLIGFGCLPSTGEFTRSMMMMISTIYLAARIALIVLMLMTLRSLPPGAYDVVSWTGFIPHF